MSTDPNAITARHPKVPEYRKKSGPAVSRTRPAPGAAPGNAARNTNKDRSDQSHQQYMALVSKSGGTKSGTEEVSADKSEVADDELPAKGQNP